MNRRDFTRGLLALSAAPALPAGALASSAPATAASTASASHMYFVGWYTAKLNKTCSPEGLAAKLKVDPQVAREIFGKLVQNGTVSAPDALGISRTLDPLPRRIRPAARVLSETGERMKRRAKAHLREMLEEDELCIDPAAFDEEEHATKNDNSDTPSDSDHQLS